MKKIFQNASYRQLLPVLRQSNLNISVLYINWHTYMSFMVRNVTVLFQTVYYWLSNYPGSLILLNKKRSHDPISLWDDIGWKSNDKGLWDLRKIRSPNWIQTVLKLFKCYKPVKCNAWRLTVLECGLVGSWKFHHGNICLKSQCWL